MHSIETPDASTCWSDGRRHCFHRLGDLQASFVTDSNHDGIDVEQGAKHGADVCSQIYRKLEFNLGAVIAPDASIKDQISRAQWGFHMHLGDLIFEPVVNSHI